MQVREEKLMKFLVESIADRLATSVAKFSGSKARLRLESAFNEATEGSCFGLTGTAFRVVVADGDWEDGQKLLERIIASAGEIVGKNTVRREVAAVLADTEAKLGTSLYEVYFRLGIHDYK